MHSPGNYMMRNLSSFNFVVFKVSHWKIVMNLKSKVNTYKMETSFIWSCTWITWIFNAMYILILLYSYPFYKWTRGISRLLSRTIITSIISQAWRHVGIRRECNENFISKAVFHVLHVLRLLTNFSNMIFVCTYSRKSAFLIYLT